MDDWSLLQKPQANLALRLLDRPTVRLLDILILHYELPVRIFLALFVLLNAALLSLLAFRLLHSGIVALFTGYMALLLFPAHEILYPTLGVPALFAFSCAILGLHAFLSALNGRYALAWAIAGTAGFTISLMYHETVFLLLLLLPFLVTVRFWSQSRSLALPQIQIKRALLLIVVSIFIPIAGFVLLSHQSSQLRGGLDISIDILHRYAGYLERLYWMVLDRSWGWQIFFVEAPRIGVHEIISRPVGMLVLMASVALALLASLRAYAAEDVVVPSRAIGLGLGTAGLWFFGLLVTGTLFKGQILEYRMLYAPFMGLALAMAMLVYKGVQIAKRFSPILAKILTLIPAAWLIFSCVTAVGLAKIYQLRYIQSQLQIEALVRQVPAHLLPEGTVIAPVHLQENSVSRLGVFTWAKTSDSLLFGVFEIPWSAEPAIQMAYGRSDLHVITNHRWAEGLHFTDIRTSSGRCGPADVEIELEGQPVCGSQLLAFTYRDGKIALANPLALMYPDGRRIEVTLPLVASLSQAGIPAHPLEVLWRAVQ